MSSRDRDGGIKLESVQKGNEISKKAGKRKSTWIFV